MWHALSMWSVLVPIALLQNLDQRPNKEIKWRKKPYFKYLGKRKEVPFFEKRKKEIRPAIAAIAAESGTTTNSGSKRAISDEKWYKNRIELAAFRRCL